MNVLFLYTTKYGTATWAAQETAAVLKDEFSIDSQLVQLGKQPLPALGDFNAVVLGGAIYAGQISPKMRNFAEAHLPELKDKPLGLYVTCLAEGEAAMEYIESNFPPALLAHACAKVTPGGKADFEKLNWLFKFVMKKVSGLTQTTDKRHPEVPGLLARSLAAALDQIPA
jgi:menaquinone-dependent protoporphyrinogen oxidase